MPEARARFPVEMVGGVPVVVTPEEIDITGLDRVLPHFATLAEALEAASRRAEGI